MKTSVPACVVVLTLLATPVAAQSGEATASPPQTPSATDLTRALNGGPPFVAPTPAATPARTPAPAPAPASTAAPAPAIRPAVVAAPAPVTRAPSAPAPTAARPVVPEAPAAVPAPVAATPAAPAVPAYRPLDATARAILPFRLDLPEGFEIGTGRPGPDFTIYSVRRDGVPFVMIYAGPASQFPIYDGQLAEVAGRASVVVTETDGRHALEHLFQRATAPREIHVWVTSLDGPERAVAERIAQSVDLR